jgi:prevent-host-death family protein
MLTMTIKEARTCLGKLVDRAEKGQTVVITRRGKESARLVPVPKHPEGLPSLREFRSAMVSPKSELSATVIAARDEERF